MSKKIFVGGLAWATDDEGLKKAFEEYGEVREAKVIMDRETNRSRGFGFVTYASEESVEKAIAGMDGQELDGRAVRVNEAEEKSRGGGGGGGGRRDEGRRNDRGGGGGGRR